MIASAKTLDLNSAKDLAGKKIGTTLGTNVEYFTYKLLNTAGARPRSSTPVPPTSCPRWCAATSMRRDVPDLLRRRQEDARRRLSRADLERIRAAHDHRGVRGDPVEKDPDMVAKFVAALVKADEIIRKIPPERRRSFSQT